MKSCRVCKDKRHAKGLCRFHYQRVKSGVPLMQPRQIHDGRQGCRVDECEGKHEAKGLCSFHWTRQSKGIPLEAVNLKGEEGRRWGARIHAMAQLPDDIKEAYGA